MLVVLTVIGGSYGVAVFGAVPGETRIGIVVTVSLTVVAAVLMSCVRPGRWFTGKQFHQYDVYE